MVWLLLLILTLLLGSQTILGGWVPEPCGTVIRIQAVYWFVGYVARSVVLLMVQPESVRNDVLADERLVTPTYADGLVPVLKIVVVAEIAFLAALVVLTAAVSGRRQEGYKRTATATAMEARRGSLTIILFGILTATRLVWFAGLRSAYVTTLLGLAPIVIGLVLLSGERSERQRRWILLLAGTEFSWSIIFQSKTPIFALVFALLLWRSGGVSRKSVRRVLVLLVSLPVLLLCFGYIQQIKQGASVREDLVAVDARYPAEIRPYLPILRRFDLLQAVTDASYASGHWIGPAEALSRGAESFIPRPLNPDKDANAGKTWLVEVRAQSVDVIPGNSLAEGVAAEGFAISGYIGAAAEASILALLVVLLSRTLYSGNLFVSCLCVPIVLSPMLEERGILGILDGFGKAWQVAVLVVIISAVFVRDAEARSDGQGKPLLPASEEKVGRENLNLTALRS